MYNEAKNFEVEVFIQSITKTSTETTENFVFEFGLLSKLMKL